MDDVYKTLATHLDNLPGGFPATESGVELRILKRLFNPREARIAAGLTMMLESPADIAGRFGLPEPEMASMLSQMSQKGLILRSEKGSPKYMAAQFVVGIWEYHVNDLDPGLIDDFNEYVPALMTTQLTLKTHQLRVIPVSRSISAEMRIMPYEQAEMIIRAQSKILVAPCICRREHRLTGRGCDNPLETCLVFGGGARYYEGNGIGRTISQAEALDILHQGMDAGLVLQPGNAKKPLNICMCCGCCCQILKNLKKLDNPAQVVCSSFYARVTEANCIACGQCVERCQMDAITVAETARVAAGRCIGCGLCVPVCEYGAMALYEKAESERWDPPANIVGTYINIARERGKL